MASMSQGVLVLGAGHAGARLALQLRKRGWQDPIRVVGDETDPPYERPPLSKEVLSAGADPLVNRIGSEALFREQDIDLELGTVALSIDPAGSRVALSDGRALAFDKLVIATGTRARRLRVPGAEAEGLFYLRTAEDARRLLPELAPGKRVLLVGGGFIGLEIASSAVKRQCDVTVVEKAPALMSRVIGEDLSAFVLDLHRSKGVSVLLGRGVSRVRTAAGRLTGLELDDGSNIDGDLVVVGIGAAPNQELALAAGLPCDDGVITDRYCRTEAPDIFAIGDVARHENELLPGRWRLESWENAERQAEIVASSLVGATMPYRCVPWFWTDQFETNLQLLGLPQPFDRTLVRGTIGEGPCAVLRLSERRIVTACLVDRAVDRRPLRKLMEEGRDIDPDALADPDTSLRDLAR